MKPSTGLSKFGKKEVWLMAENVAKQITAFVKEQEERAIALWEANLSSRDTRMTSL